MGLSRRPFGGVVTRSCWRFRAAETRAPLEGAMTEALRSPAQGSFWLRTLMSERSPSSMALLGATASMQRDILRAALEPVATVAVRRGEVGPGSDS